MRQVGVLERVNMGWRERLHEIAEQSRAERREREASDNAAGTVKLLDLSHRIARKVSIVGAKWRIWKEAHVGTDELEPQWIQLAILGELRAIREELAALRAAAEKER